MRQHTIYWGVYTIRRPKSSLKFLLSHEPIYMAAVCDAIAGKMDMLLRGDTPAINKNNRWDVLLQEYCRVSQKKTLFSLQLFENLRGWRQR